MHSYPRNAGDYRRDTPHLTLVEHGAYGLLLDWYYASEKPLPDDIQLLCRICGAVKADERRAVAMVVKSFFTLVDGKYRQRRCDAEIAKYKGNSLGGKRGSKTRWSDKSKCESPHESPDESPGESRDESPDDNQNQNQNQNQITATHTLPKIPGSVAQAVEIGSTVGVPADYSETIFLEHDGSTWEDSQGRPINNFASYLKGRYNQRQNKRAREGTAPAKDVVYSEDFLAFWTAYPRKQGKGEAWKAWGRIKSRPELSVILEAVARAVSSPEWLKDNGAFIPHPSTWLNGRRWEDEGRTPPPAQLEF